MPGLNGTPLDIAGQMAKQQARLQQITAATGMAVYAHLVGQLYVGVKADVPGTAFEPTPDQLRKAAMQAQRAAAYYAESLGLCNVADKADGS